MLSPGTICYFDEKMSNPNISIQGAPKKPPELFKKEMNLEKLGIGGLNAEVRQALIHVLECPLIGVEHCSSERFFDEHFPHECFPRL